MDDKYIDNKFKNVGDRIDHIGEHLDSKMDHIYDALVRQEDTFKTHEQNDREDIGKIHDSLSNIDDRLGEYNSQLDRHIMNSEANSKQLKILQDIMLPIIESNRDKEAVVKWAAAKFSKTVKTLSVISVSLGIIFTIIKLLGYI